MKFTRQRATAANIVKSLIFINFTDFYVFYLFLNELAMRAKYGAYVTMYFSKDKDFYPIGSDLA
ncbi:MAG TPA: hypothetical protein DEB48_06865 [Verrucomicrobiales bacterium]|nr:hypothetical protein [Verrucomicrobiales bacterium]HBU59548.1 hypothetical protein [Verrucomicrobiales bacterium]